ncbi:MAG: hypothetical protein ABL928_11890 [Sphingorhabdus sp.]
MSIMLVREFGQDAKKVGFDGLSAMREISEPGAVGISYLLTAFVAGFSVPQDLVK